MKSWRWVVVMLAVVVALVGALAPDAFAAGQKLGQQPGIVLPDGVVLGMTYGEWSAAWWQWALTFNYPWPPVPNPPNPFGGNCAMGQSAGPVFYLVGGQNVTRHCTIPAGKTLVFPILNQECSTLEVGTIWYGGNERELRTCAEKLGDTVDLDTLEVTIDGKKAKNLEYFRAVSPVFEFDIPSTGQNFLGVDPTLGTHGKSVSDGYWVIVEPLSPGHHVIYFEGNWKECPGCAQVVTYHLTVTK